MGNQEATLLFEDQTGARHGWGRSILFGPPSEWLISRGGLARDGATGEVVDDPLGWMRARHRNDDSNRELPFVGGLAGVAGFELGWDLDDLNAPRREASTPDLWVGRFDSAAIFDARQQIWTVVGENDAQIDYLCGILHSVPAHSPEFRGSSRRIDGDVEAADYHRRVGQAVDAIYGGEFFEVNYTERFRGRWARDRRALYEGLRRRAPGGFGGVADLGEIFVASVSPEQFLCVDPGGRVYTRPIKGTRPRGATDEEDRKLAAELLESEKDRAENIMIVDLMRNDLTRVCEPGSVVVSELCGLHSFASVHHLVSTVEGRLASGFDGLDAFLASFPAGSITGAPKLRSMEWIADHEASPRGPYTGSFFYWSDHGRFDSNVLIRTALVCGGAVEYGAGGAVVADSDPIGEFEEALWKARPFLDLLEDL